MRHNAAVHGSHEFLNNLALVLCVAAVTTVVLQRLRQPVVLGYIVAGLIIGPHLSVPLVADPELIQTLSELGVILVMFSIGLEFSLRRLFRTGIVVAVIALIEVSMMLWLGFAVARAFAWPTADAILAGAAVSISSTTIIAKTFEEQGVRGRIREIVFGVLIFEDLIAIVLLATLPSVVARADRAMDTLASTTFRLGLFLILLLVVGMLVVPRLFRAVVRLRSHETTLVASIGLCFALALLVARFGYSVALGAFLAGALVAESGAGTKVEHLIRPVRDMFAAIFFVSVGMMIEPRLVGDNLPAIALLTGVVLAGKIVAVTLAAFLTGNGVRDSVQSGISLAQIGEFSFIIVGMGIGLGMASPFLFPAVVTVSFVTTLTTPFLVRRSGRWAARAHERLPAALQTFTALYGTWIERLRAQSGGPRSRLQRVRRLALLLAVDAVAVGGVVIGASLVQRPATAWLGERLGVQPALALLALVVLVLLVVAPFALGVVRVSRGLGLALAELALPSAAQGKLDLAAAPRRALVVTLQLAVVLAVGLPLLAVTQPFLPPFRGALVLLLGVFVLLLAFWKSAANLQGHVRAGAEVVVELLAAQSHEPSRHTGQFAVAQVAPGPGTGEHAVVSGAAPALAPGPEALARAQHSLPGLGNLAQLQVEPASPAVGKTLVELNLRGLTGATVLAILRPGGAVLVPTGGEPLQAGDLLAVTGTSAAVEAARALIAGARAAQPRVADA